MLIKATIENFLSYDVPATLSLIAGKITKQHNEQVTRINGVSVLRGAILYGPNASGKSNFLKAMSKLMEMVNGDSCRYALRCQFRLTDKPRPDMAWDVVYSRNDRIFRYYVKTDGIAVKEEKLNLLVEDEKEIFVREGLSVRYGEMIKNKSWYEGRTFEQSGFLVRTLKRDGILERRGEIDQADIVADAIDGLQNLIVLGYDPRPEAQYLGSLLSADDFAKFLKRLMTVADVGITDIVWHECTRDEAIRIADRHLSVTDTMHDGVRFVKDGQTLWMVTVQHGKILVQELNFVHNGITMSLAEESDGTIRLFNLSVFLYNLMKQSTVWMVDEIDCHLHPCIAYKILKEFMTMPDAKSQLIVTAHDTSLMTHDIWRTDEVWFAEKRLDGSSDLYSLYQFTPRFDKRLEKGYRQGLYGAMPHIGGEMLNG